MNLASTRFGRSVAAAAIAALVFAVSACAPEDDNNSGSTPDTSSDTGATSGGETSAAADECAIDNLNLVTPGTLTAGTDQPAYPPWFHGKPSSGKGYESAVTYATAKQMGFTPDQVTWVDVPFNSSYAPGDKNFDFDVNQISITPDRAKAVDFSQGYYTTTQALVVLDDSPFADATSLADLKDARIGAQIGTTSYHAAQDVIQPTTDVAVYDSTNDAKSALVNGQIDAVVADLWTAFYISDFQVKDSKVIGQFQASPGNEEELGMLFQKGNPLVTCVDKALDVLKSDGTLQKLQDKWLGRSDDVATLE